MAAVILGIKKAQVTVRANASPAAAHSAFPRLHVLFSLSAANFFRVLDPKQPRYCQTTRVSLSGGLTNATQAPFAS